MEMPIFFFPVLPSSSLIRSIFDVPWIDMKLPFIIKILFNALLFSQFGFIHTFFAQNNIQQYLIDNLSFSKSTLRTFYLILTNISSWLLMGLWQHISIPIWDFFKYFSIFTERHQRHVILMSLFSLISLPGMNR